MAIEKLGVGEISNSRFEFRSFSQNFDKEHYLMSRLSIVVPKELWERESEEIYIVSITNDINNIKIRDSKIDIKSLIQTVDRLEQWNPLMKAEFPITEKTLMEEVFPAFQIEMPEITKNAFSYEEFMNIINSHQDLQSVRVKKHRFGYKINETICEVAEVLINGAKLMTINSESAEIEDIKKTMAEVGIAQLENINYLQAIKRVIGMIDKPFGYESLF